VSTVLSIVSTSLCRDTFHISILYSRGGVWEYEVYFSGILIFFFYIFTSLLCKEDSIYLFKLISKRLLGLTEKNSCGDPEMMGRWLALSFFTIHIPVFRFNDVRHKRCGCYVVII